MFGWINRVIGGHGVGFDPTLQQFPDINVSAIARKLRLAKRGKTDGSQNVPDQKQTVLTHAEREAIQEVDKWRKDAVNNFDLEMSAYRSRIADAHTDSSEIKLQIANAVAALQSVENKESNHLENARVRVKGMQDKLKAFQKKHNIDGPPRRSHPIWFTIPAFAIVFLIETILNGYFFAQRHELGQIGGVSQAIVISMINIALGVLTGILVRYVNLNVKFHKVLGIISVIVGFCSAVAFNLMTAHFRDALESNDWNSSLTLAISKLTEDPIGLASMASVTLFILGFLVAFLSFLKGMIQIDPIPGYNKLWDEVEWSREDYAHQFEIASSNIDAEFQTQKSLLRSEVERRRYNLRSAIDAIGSQSSTRGNFQTFLDFTENAANQLLRIYREANTAARSKPAPNYFDKDYAYDRDELAITDMPDLNTGSVEEEIRRMEELMNMGVKRLASAQKWSIGAFSVTRDFSEEEKNRESRESNPVLNELLADLDQFENLPLFSESGNEQRAVKGAPTSKGLNPRRSAKSSNPRGKSSSTLSQPRKTDTQSVSKKRKPPNQKEGDR